jgi:hypothetical protein
MMYDEIISIKPKAAVIQSIERIMRIRNGGMLIIHSYDIN